MKRLKDESGQALVVPALCSTCPSGFLGLPAHVSRDETVAADNASVGGPSRRGFVRFLHRLRRNQGQALIEYILVLPMVFLLLVNAVNFGGFFYAFITVANAARAGADYAIMGGASVASGHISLASSSQITTLITTEIASLPNHASLSVNICQNNNGTIKTISGTCSSIAADPEPASYVVTSIDVTYTYVPLIPVFSFPNLHVYATLPATSIHRRAVMRSLQ